MISQTSRSRRLFAGWALVLFVASGCGGNERQEVVPVTGRVEFQGKGVPRAAVIFHPVDLADEGAKRLRPFAYADDDGNFKLKTYVSDDGAPPGEYRVSIVAASTNPAGRSKDGPVQDEPAATTVLMIPQTISQKYGNVETAGITVQIKPEGNQLEPFQLQ